jgi:hypothetical protein
VLLDGAPPASIPEQVFSLSLADLDDLEVARQLTLIDHQLFKAVRPREFLNL